VLQTGGTADALCAQRALKALTTVGGVTTEACAAAVATTVGSLGWAAVRSTQLANLDSAAALALKLCSLSPDKRCSGTAAAAAAATVAPGAATAATTE
jgi:hypothetical protein